MMQNNAFFRVSADTKTWATCPTRAVLALNTCHFYGDCNYTKLRANVQ